MKKDNPKLMPLEELFVLEEMKISDLGNFIVKYLNFYSDTHKDVKLGEVWQALVSYVNITLQKQFVDKHIDNFLYTIEWDEEE